MSKKPFLIGKKPEGVHAPLSLAQRRLWFLYQLNPQSSEYNISRAWRLKGSLNTEALATSLNLILTRHDALRTIFQEFEGQPVQVIRPTLTVPFQERDCSSHPPIQLEAEIDRLLIDEPLKPFDLLTGPLLRFTLMRCGPDDHVLVFTVHHMVFDGTSLKNFCQELSRCYTATLAGQACPLTPLPIQFQDYAYWQQDHVTDEKLASQLAYWKQQLHGAPLVLEIPSDFSRPKENTGPEGFQAFTLAHQVISNLKQLIQPQGITVFMALLAVFQILLARYTGQRDFLVGTLIAGRTH
ncbi:MAG: condensation domain-containing protein, partial [Nitrospirales bacterium]